ncbi:N-acetylmuramoyl-L-alanine amidase-like domain-containing protein, partial [Algoriphagus sp.]|uniref:N-acetylmuramoyl-L-alanine amidase-like domain-containing protein n=1 Tax=Algoriphagus sp. TaxID=1872435 RepID=UPI0025CFBBBF
MKKFIFLLLILSPYYSFSQTVCTLENKAKLEETLNELAQQGLADLATNQQVIAIGKNFLKTPYVEKTLEIPGPEQLVINLNGLDCTTYLETVIALVRLSEKSDFSFETFEKELEFIRYRDGKNEGYPSRLHYFSDWIF